MRPVESSPPLHKDYSPSKPSIGLMNNDLENFLSPQAANEMAWHEYAHMAADKLGKGELGYQVGSDMVIAFYVVFGPRPPEMMMEIASAPGWSKMSKQDRDVYHYWEAIFLQEQREANLEQTDIEPQLLNPNEKEEEIEKIRTGIQLVGIVSKKLKELGEDDDFPDFDEVVHTELSDLFDKYGVAIKWAYSEALDQLLEEKVSDELELEEAGDGSELENGDFVGGVVYIDKDDNTIM